MGGIVGVGMGLAARVLLRGLQLPAAGLYPVLTLAVAFLSFGLATLLEGSGFVAVYATGLVLAAGPLPYGAGVRRVHDALAWLSQITMFTLLGLLVFPSRLLPEIGVGLALAASLAFLARPLAVGLVLALLRVPRKELAFISWVGLRGAVPIILATFPVMAGVTGAERIFDVVFFVVVVNALLPGATVTWITKRLQLLSDHPPPPQAVLEISSTQALDGELVSFHVSPALVVAGVRISELPLPEGCRLLLIVRGQNLIAPEGSTVLAVNDHVYLFFRPKDRALVQLLFGDQEVA